METRFQKHKNKKRLRLRAGWQEKLPLKALAVCLAAVLGLFLLLLINAPASSYVDSAEVSVLRTRDILRVGVDTSVFGLSNNGAGLEIAMTEALSEVIFSAADACETVETTRQKVAMDFTDGNIDLAIMSLSSLSGYTATSIPFYVDAVVLMGYTVKTDLTGVKIAALYNTAAESVLKKYIETEAPGAVAVPYADYYDMLLALRSGTVDCVAMTRTAALSHKTAELTIYPGKIGTTEYHILVKNSDATLLSVVEALLTEWIEDGTLKKWYKMYKLTY